MLRIHLFPLEHLSQKHHIKDRDNFNEIFLVAMEFQILFTQKYFTQVKKKLTFTY